MNLNVCNLNCMHPAYNLAQTGLRAPHNLPECYKWNKNIARIQHHDDCIHEAWHGRKRQTMGQKSMSSVPDAATTILTVHTPREVITADSVSNTTNCRPCLQPTAVVQINSHHRPSTCCEVGEVCLPLLQPLLPGCRWAVVLTHTALPGVFLLGV